MATSPRVAMRAVRNLFGTVIPKVNVPEGITTTFKKGAPCVCTSGYLVECGADPALILGLATQDAGNGAANGTYSQVVEVAMPGILFMGNLSGSTDVSVTADTDRFTPYGIEKHSASGKWYVDKLDTSADRVVVWEFWLQDMEVLGDIRGRVLFQFDPVYCQGSAVD